MTRSQIELNAQTKELRKAATRYLRANAFLTILRGRLDVVTHDDFIALRNMALGGDVEGAEIALEEILKRR